MAIISSSTTEGGQLNTPFVSVIMNCYNGARYLHAALDSVRTQSFSDWEIIFWDNQSTDESASIFKSYNDPRFRYFLASEHTILGKAKGLAIKNARGEWLAFLDCDDMWCPDKLERQISIISEENLELGLVYGRSEILCEEGTEDTAMGRSALAAYRKSAAKSLPEGNLFVDLLKKNFIPQPSAMVRRSAYWAVGGINPQRRHSWDYELFVGVAKVFKVRAVQGIVCTYRIHGTNLCYTQLEDSYRDAIGVVAQYLPATEAAQAIRSYQTYFAVEELRQGRVLQGLRRLQVHGDIWLFLTKSIAFVWRRLCGV